MLKNIKLIEIGKNFSGKKLNKVVVKNGWIYDYKWKMVFKSEKYRQEFLDAIKKGIEDIERGRIYTQKEMDEYYRTEFGINI